MSSYVEELFSVTDKVAIVTGAAAGMGEAIAIGLGKAGAKVAVADRDEEGGAATAKAINDAGGAATFYAIDLVDTDRIQEVCKEVADEYGQIDILVNAAGVTFPLKDTDTLEERLANYDLTMSIDLRAAYALTIAAREHMKKAGGGSVINITSINSVVGFPGNPGYVAAKGGMRMMTKGLAMDLTGDNIRVNNIAPGYIKTAMTAGSQADPEMYNARLRHMIVERWGEPEDMVGATIYLASQASSYVTGQDIFVDGGWTAKGLT